VAITVNIALTGNESPRVLNYVNHFTKHILEQQDVIPLERLLKPIWKSLIIRNFNRRKYLGLPTSNRLANALIVQIPSNNILRLQTRLLYRNATDSEGGKCHDYATILFEGYAGGKPTMGKWKARSNTGRLIDAQLFDLEGNPIGTHGGMPPHLRRVGDIFVKEASKLVELYINKKFYKGLRKVK
jgi:hypothetical protein